MQLSRLLMQFINLQSDWQPKTGGGEQKNIVEKLIDYTYMLKHVDLDKPWYRKDLSKYKTSQ